MMYLTLDYRASVPCKTAVNYNQYGAKATGKGYGNRCPAQDQALTAYDFLPRTSRRVVTECCVHCNDRSQKNKASRKARRLASGELKPIPHTKAKNEQLDAHFGSSGIWQSRPLRAAP